MINWEKYFGTPEKTAEMNIIPWSHDFEMEDGIEVWRNDDLVFYGYNYHGKTFLEWLQEECDTEEEASLNE